MTPIARFGTAVGFTGQLQYTDGGLDKDTTVGTDGKTAAEYSLVVHVLTGHHRWNESSRLLITPAQ